MPTALHRLLEGLLGRLRRSRGGRLSAAEVGIRGEREAAKYLKRQHYAVLERNFRVTQGEIDLVVFRDGVLAFVEVRAQTAPMLVDPLQTITRRKQKRIIIAAEQYAAIHDLASEDVELRFDVVTVLFGQDGSEPILTHLEGAFGQSRRSF
jgi:putative endonuclease